MSTNTLKQNIGNSHDLFAGGNITPIYISASVASGTSYVLGEVVQCSDGTAVSKHTGNAQAVGAVCVEAVTGGASVKGSFAVAGYFRGSKLVYADGVTQAGVWDGARKNNIVIT